MQRFLGKTLQLEHLVLDQIHGKDYQCVLLYVGVIHEGFERYRGFLGTLKGLLPFPSK